MPNAITKPTHGSNEWLWLRHRDENGRPVITASDAAAVHGEHQYKTRYELFREKLADQPPYTEQNEAMERGTRLEPAIREWASARLGVKLVEPKFMYWNGSSQMPMMVTPDAINEDHEHLWHNSPDVYVEIKTYSKLWTGELPRTWYWQGVHAAICADIEVVTWAIFDSTLSLHIYEQKITEEEKEQHRHAVMDFVWWLDTGEPNPDWPMTYDDVSQANPNSITGSVDISEAAPLLDVLRELNVQKKELADQESELKARIGALLGSFESGTVNGDVAVTWRSQPRTSFDSKAFEKDHPELFKKYQKESSFRVMRLKGEK